MILGSVGSVHFVALEGGTEEGLQAVKKCSGRQPFELNSIKMGPGKSVVIEEVKVYGRM